MKRAGGWGIIGLFAAGCVAPPLRIGAGGGGAAGHVLVQGQDRTMDHPGAALGELRAAVTPLSLAAEPPTHFDLSLGWSLDRTIAPAHHGLLTGPFAEGVWFTRVHPNPYNDREQWRFGPLVMVEAPFDPLPSNDADRIRGVGVAGGVLLEALDRHDGPILLGAQRGYFAIGLSARVGVVHLSDETYSYVMLTVEVRTPGIAALPIPAPSRTPGLTY